MRLSRPISVIMPVYNAERYLAEAVESILGQTFSDFEFLIIDDGSTDGSLEILRKYAGRDSRIRLSSRPNTGLVVALNEMLGNARGEYIARMDADDLALPDRLGKQVAYLRENPDCICLGSQIMLVDPASRELMSMPLPTDHESIDLELLKGTTVICHPVSTYRAETVKRVGGYRQDFWPAEDIDLWLRMSEIGRLANLSDILLKYRMHPTSVGHTNRNRQLRAAWQAVKDAYERRGWLFTQELPEDRNDHIQNINLRWGWWALKGGNVGVARHYAAKCVLSSPFESQSWKLAACALRGR